MARSVVEVLRKAERERARNQACCQRECDSRERNIDLRLFGSCFAASLRRFPERPRRAVGVAATCAFVVSCCFWGIRVGVRGGGSEASGNPQSSSWSQSRRGNERRESERAGALVAAVVDCGTRAETEEKEAKRKEREGEGKGKKVGSGKKAR